MRRTALAMIAAGLVLTATGAAAGQFTFGGERPVPDPDLTDPDLPNAEKANAGLPLWLAGTWMMQDGARWADAVWTTPRGGMILGLMRNGFGAGQDSWEALRIVRKKDGLITLVTERKGGPALDYPLAVAGADSMEFSDAAHSPQRIRLWRAGQLLMTETSRLDGSDAVRMNYRPVETAPKD